MRVGFIGLGIMGAPMARNLIRAGYAPVVFNRTREKMQPLVEAGARGASSPRQVAKDADVIITMVSDTPDVEMVLFGPDGVAGGLSCGQTVIDMSTISPDATIEFARRLAEKDCAMLDAPVTGGEKGAIDGTLTIMAGGRREVFEMCLPILQAMGKNIVYTGPSGSGQRTKLVNQIIAALHLVAMAEGLRFATAAGLDLETTLRAVSNGAAGSWILSNLGPRVLRHDFAPGFSIRLQQKDLRLVVEAARKMNETLPGAELAYKIFSEAVARGFGEQGTQGLINLYSENKGGDQTAAARESRQPD